MPFQTPKHLALGTALLGCAFSTELGSQLGSGHPDHAHYGGSVMQRTFTQYKGLPVGEDALKAAGWTKHGTTCDPALGFAWTEATSGATQEQPWKLYTTAGGQPAGVGIIIRGQGQEPLPAPQKMWATAKPLVEPKTADIAHIDVAFRSGSIVCSGSKDSGAIGSTLIVNPTDSKQSKSLPLLEKDAKAQGWHRGSCFDGMGWHWFLDTSKGDGDLSWQAAQLFPVVTMFDKGEINAIFFASTINQVTTPIIKSNEWEPMALSDSQMCANLCDKDCTFSGLTSAGPWSTAHIYFRDHKEVTCDSNLKCGLTEPFRGNCCESTTIV